MIRSNLDLPKPLTAEEEADLFQNWDCDSWKILAERNMRLAVYSANKWHGTGIDPDDLLSLAFMGMTKAAKAFRPELGYKFATYATAAINNEIMMEIRRQKKHMHVLSYNHPLTEDETGDIYTLEDLLPSSADLEGVAGMLCLSETIEMLPDLERKIIKLRRDGMGQMEIAKLLGYSQANISRREKSAKNKLRKVTGL